MESKLESQRNLCVSTNSDDRPFTAMQKLDREPLTVRFCSIFCNREAIENRIPQ